MGHGMTRRSAELACACRRVAQPPLRQVSERRRRCDSMFCVANRSHGGCAVVAHVRAHSMLSLPSDACFGLGGCVRRPGLHMRAARVISDLGDGTRRKYKLSFIRHVHSQYERNRYLLVCLAPTIGCVRIRPRWQRASSLRDVIFQPCCCPGSQITAVEHIHS
jgi:hypothetical protein